ncbi:MAG: adenylosuccinate lyase [Alphaproteobacteria bacterium]|nr:adenylosuccinate lyase [Alphaproteobacteria bacterium]MCB1551411.1 adenylosuccinate lyase [Alphaproteobacteria bacterium]MCB9985008.1 adenylosuccinate lyase [Micavibrio sp.]
MIPRYTRPDMAAIWDADNKFRIMLEVETLAAEAMEQTGIIPQGVSKALRERGNFNANRIDEIEREVKHDVIAFLTNVTEYVGEEARFMHQGMTSSDVLDTTFAVQLQQSADIMLADLDKLLAALKKRITEHKDTLCIGRSHGIHAEPTTFGIKLAGHYAAFARAKKRLEYAREEISVCAISGAIGTYATVDPAIESYVAEKLGLTPETVSTQVIPRDRHAMFFSVMGVIASSIENLAIEIRHLQRTEVREVEEFFSKGQKGSSAMPHKRNPILTENLTGLARVVRSSVIPALENVALWHERDISHSSVERFIAPDTCVALDFALNRMANVIENLLIYPDRMKTNLERMGGLVFSQRTLLALTQAGISREDSYSIVQRNAMKVWESDGKTTLRELLEKDIDVTVKLDKTALDKIFDYAAYTKHARTIINRALN